MQNVLLRSPLSDAWTTWKLRNSYKKKNDIPQTGIGSYTDKMRRVGIMKCIETENTVQDSRHHQQNWNANIEKIWTGIYDFRGSFNIRGGTQKFPEKKKKKFI
jgi:hypothetical protein